MENEENGVSGKKILPQIANKLGYINLDSYHRFPLVQ
jgi:hypothetical protein